MIMQCHAGTGHVKVSEGKTLIKHERSLNRSVTVDSGWSETSSTANWRCLGLLYYKLYVRNTQYFDKGCFFVFTVKRQTIHFFKLHKQLKCIFPTVLG